MEDKNKFEKRYNITDEVIAAIKKPIVRRKLKSKFQATQISIGEEITKLELEQNKLEEDVENLNINRLIEIEDEISWHKEDLATIKKMYLDWFGKELKDIDDEA